MIRYVMRCSYYGRATRVRMNRYLFIYFFECLQFSPSPGNPRTERNEEFTEQGT